MDAAASTAVQLLRLRQERRLACVTAPPCLERWLVYGATMDTGDDHRHQIDFEAPPTPPAAADLGDYRTGPRNTGSLEHGAGPMRTQSIPQQRPATGQSHHGSAEAPRLGLSLGASRSASAAATLNATSRSRRLVSTPYSAGGCRPGGVPASSVAEFTRSLARAKLAATGESRLSRTRTPDTHNVERWHELGYGTQSQNSGGGPDLITRPPSPLGYAEQMRRVGVAELRAKHNKEWAETTPVS